MVAELGERSDAEIIVVDDCSTDDPLSVVEEIGGGLVRYERNPLNLGAIGTFNRCVELASGEFVHLLHGDDLILPGFYPALERALLAHPEAVAAMSRTQYIDGDDKPGPVTRRYRSGTGPWVGALRSVVISNRVRPPSIVVRRSAYEQVGTYRDALPHAADWDMWVRLAAAGPLIFVDEILACYRRHEEQDTAVRMKSGVNIRERIEAIGLVTQNVPERQRGTFERVALLYSAAFATRSAVGLAAKRRWPVAAVQLREAGRCLLKVPGGV